MARPKVPLISRRRVIQAALDILEREGPDALTIRRLGEELHVNGASLYHHFSSKEDILASAGRAALAELVVPVLAEGQDWQEWFADVGVRYAAFLAERPYMLPLMVAGYIPRISLPVASTAMQHMTQMGIPADAHPFILDTIEAFLFGTALRKQVHREEIPLTAKQQAERDGAFAVIVLDMIRSLVSYFTPNGRQAPAPAKAARPAGRARAKTTLAAEKSTL